MANGLLMGGSLFLIFGLASFCPVGAYLSILLIANGELPLHL